MADEDPVSELDLAGLRAFLDGSLPGATGTAAPESSPAAAAPDPWAAAGGDPWAPKAGLPLPPGFEHGPNTGAGPSNGMAAGNGTTPAAGRGPRSGLTGEDRAKVVVEPQDPTARLLAATSWDELNLPKEILDGIYEMGFVKPSKIQEWTLPIALNGGNIIGQAQNGSGKTAAFALAMLLRVDVRWKCPQGMCVCPTRELATQNHDVIQKLGKHTWLELFLAVAQGQGERPPRKVEAQVVVGTPGKMKDLIKKGIIKSKDFSIFVVDEADEMIDEDRQMGPQVRAIKDMLHPEVQVLLFSATWPDPVERFAQTIAPSANRIKVQKEDLTLDTITQTFIDVGDDPRKKDALLSDLYGAMNIGQSIIFVNTRSKAFELAKHMKAEGHRVSLICGTQETGAERIDPAYRDRIMHEFRTGITKVLISTNVLSRGIDVPAVTLVVNYDLPTVYGSRDSPEMETYMHRIGRTGRFGLKGVAVNLVTPSERGLLDRIKTHYQCSIKQLSGDCEEMEALLRDLR